MIIKSLLDLFNFLKSLDQNLCFSQEEICSAADTSIFKKAPIQLVSTGDGVALKHYLKAFSELYNFERLAEEKDVPEHQLAEEIMHAVYDLDFESPKFIHLNNAHGSCDCPKCKNDEHILEENEYFDESCGYGDEKVMQAKLEFAAQMGFYLETKMKSFPICM